MHKVTNERRGNNVSYYVVSVTGSLMQAWYSPTDLRCANPRCAQVIAHDTMFTVHTLAWFDRIWHYRNGQPFCRTCVPFYEQENE